MRIFIRGRAQNPKFGTFKFHPYIWCMGWFSGPVAPTDTYYFNSSGLRLISSGGISLSPSFFKISSPYMKANIS